MIQYIITSSDKNQWRIRVRQMSRNYYLSYFASLVAAFCIAILPFSLHWLSSANTEPREAVVRIQVGDAMGSGFLISPNYILTARHVVEDIAIGGKVTVSFEQAQIPIETSAVIVYFKSFNYNSLNNNNSPSLTDYLIYFENDVALLQLDEEVKQITPLTLGNSSEFSTGDVRIMGYGLDDWSEPNGRITSSSFHERNTLYKLDGSINHGHSGGPVMTLDANDVPTDVIGIVVGDFSTIFTETSGSLVRGESVALKINQATEVLSSGGYSVR